MNLLGGRAAQSTLHPLLLSELESRDFADAVQWGTLPSVVIQSNNEEKEVDSQAKTDS